MGSTITTIPEVNSPTNESRTFSNNNEHKENNNNNKSDVFHILHFNDVYNIIEGRNKGGGVSRFMTLINEFKKEMNPLILFSGDFVSPSNMSTVTKGQHMISIMNMFGIHCGMIGNHDLDYGNEHCIEILKQLNYPTLNANICTLNDDDDSDVPKEETLGKCLKYKMIKHNNYKIGIIGVSEDWTNTLTVHPKNGIIYKDFVQECQKYADLIRNNHNKSIDLMIVLTHSRLPNDLQLADEIDGIDMILGGHDHLYHVSMEERKKTLVVKSGCDFNGITYIQCIKQTQPIKNIAKISEITDRIGAMCKTDVNMDMHGSDFVFNTFHYNLKNNTTIEKDSAMCDLVSTLSSSFVSELERVIGYVSCDLECRFSVIRTRECNSANLLCDIVRRAYECDAVMLCGGGFRSDRIIEKGDFRFRDILDLVPFQDPIIVKKIRGIDIINALTHGISCLPGKLDGKFLHCSGIKYVHRDNKFVKAFIRRYAGNNNVCDHGDDCINGQCLEEYEEVLENEYYSVASREYTMNGGDGFESFKSDKHEILINDEDGSTLSTLLRNFFWAVDTVNIARKMKGSTNQNDVDGVFSIVPEMDGRIVNLMDCDETVFDYLRLKMIKLKRSLIMDLPTFVKMTDKPENEEDIIRFMQSIERAQIRFD